MLTRFCTQCGQRLPDKGRFCTNCGAPIPDPTPSSEPNYAKQEEYPFEKRPEYEFSNQSQEQSSRASGPTMPKPKNYLVLSILATILCCLPLGIPAIVYSAKVDNLWNERRYVEADDASRKAKRWMLASVIVAFLVYAIYFALIMIAVASGEDFSDYFDY